MSDATEQAFYNLRNACVSITKNPNQKTIEDLISLLQSLPCDVIEKLCDYVLFPMRVVLLKKKELKENVIISAINCMGYIFNHAKLTDSKACFDTLRMLIMCITRIENGKINSGGSEHIKLSVMCTVSALVNNASRFFWKETYRIDNMPFLGHIITVCLSIINEDERHVKKAAISLIGSLCVPSYADSLDNFDKDTFLVLRGNCMASFLPGILSVLGKIIEGSQHHSVKCEGLETTSKLLKVTLGDFEIGLLENKKIGDVIKKSNSCNSPEFLPTQRDRQWLDDCCSKVDGIFLHISAVATNPNMSVRLALAQFCFTVLTKCCQSSLKGCIQTLLNIPIKLLNDDHPKVSHLSRSIIDKVSIFLEESSDVTFLIYDSLFNICSELQHNIRKVSDEGKLSYLQLILGYLGVCKQNVQDLMNSAIHLSQLMKTILFCFEIDFSNIEIMLETTNASFQFDSTDDSLFKGQSCNWLFRKSFVNFHDKKICEYLIMICRQLGAYCKLEVIIDAALELYDDKTLCRQVVLLLNEILLGAKSRIEDKEEIIDQIDLILDLYVSPENWYFLTSFDLGHGGPHNSFQHKKLTNVLDNSSRFNRKELNAKHVNANVMLACLHLEAIATFALLLEDAFHQKLLKVLYPVLEKASDSNHLISSSAQKALEVISKSCKYENVSGLICDNADYLVSTISVHLRHLTLFPQSPVVLQAMVIHSDVRVFPLVRDTIGEILVTFDSKRTDNFHLSSILPVLLSIVVALNRWFSVEYVEVCSMTENLGPQRSKQQIVTDVKNAVVEFQKNIDILQNIEQEHLEEDDGIKEENLNDFDEAQDQAPDEIVVVDEILTRCSNLMATESPIHRLMIMEVIYEGIKLLSRHENTFLPQVHKLWRPLVMRFSDSELQVVSRAFDIILCLGDHSRDFIKRRFTKDLLPKLLEFLKTHKKSSEHINSKARPTYKYSTVFKLQTKILNKLGSLLISSSVDSYHMQTICVACVGYLSCKQPQEIQESALNLFKCLIAIDPDLLWLHLSDVFSETSILTPLNPSYHLESACLAGTKMIDNEFAGNVLVLMRSLN